MFGFFEKGFKKTLEVIKTLDKTLMAKSIDFIEKDKLEEILIEADVNYDLIEEMLENLPNEISRDDLEPRLLSCFENSKNFDEVNSKPEVHLIIGVNGAGKTTLIRSILGYYHPNSGSVSINGLDPIKDRIKVLEEAIINNDKDIIEKDKEIEKKYRDYLEALKKR